MASSKLMLPVPKGLCVLVPWSFKVPSESITCTKPILPLSMSNEFQNATGKRATFFKVTRTHHRTHISVAGVKQNTEVFLIYVGDHFQYVFGLVHDESRLKFPNDLDAVFRGAARAFFKLRFYKVFGVFIFPAVRQYGLRTRIDADGGVAAFRS